MEVDGFQRFGSSLNLPRSLGNLEPINFNNVTQINPSGLVENKYYLLYNNKTHQKVRAKYIEVEEMSNSYDEDAIDQYHYMFEDEFSTIVVEGAEDFGEDNEEDEDFEPPEPYALELTFETDYNVFLPKTGSILRGKTSKILHTDALNSVTDYVGGKNVRRFRKSKTSTRRKSSKKKRSKRNKKSKTNKKRR
jgi:hypothetical protein